MVDEIQVGFEFWVSTVFGIPARVAVWVSTVFGIPARVAVTEVKDDMADYKVVSGGLVGFLKRRADSWYDQHILYNLEGVLKSKFI